jgi:CDP-diacylglycerol---serine O-phosphatidyltransferase
MISSLPTLSWGRLRPRRRIRLEVIALSALVVAALLTEPWFTLVAICTIYLLMIPVAIFSYARVKRQRAVRNGQPAAPGAVVP